MIPVYRTRLVHPRELDRPIQLLGVVTALLNLSPFRNAEFEFPRPPDLSGPQLSRLHLFTPGFSRGVLAGACHAATLISQSHHAVCHCEVVWLS